MDGGAAGARGLSPRRLLLPSRSGQGCLSKAAGMHAPPVWEPGTVMRLIRERQVDSGPMLRIVGALSQHVHARSLQRIPPQGARQ